MHKPPPFFMPRPLLFLPGFWERKAPLLEGKGETHAHTNTHAVLILLSACTPTPTPLLRIEMETSFHSQLPVVMEGLATGARLQEAGLGFPMPGAVCMPRRRLFQVCGEGKLATAFVAVMALPRSLSLSLFLLSLGWGGCQAASEFSLPWALLPSAKSTASESPGTGLDC